MQPAQNEVGVTVERPDVAGLSLELAEREASQPTSREQTISRLAVLKAAAAFGASRPDLKSADVLKIAASWLEWVAG